MSKTLNYSSVTPKELTSQDIEFIKKWTNGVLQDEALISHILTLHNEIISSQHVYRCISQFSYLNPKSNRHPSYEEVIKVGKENQDFKILDLGTCYGQEIRLLIEDGINPSSIVATDLHDIYWNAGIKLYLDDVNPSKLGNVSTVFGDWATDVDSIGTSDDIAWKWKESFDTVLCMAILHVLSNTQSSNLLKRLLHVLKPNGLIFGWCVGAKTAKFWARTPDDKDQRWLHDINSLTSMFRTAGYSGEVIVTTMEESSSNDLEFEDKVILQFSARK